MKNMLAYRAETKLSAKGFENWNNLCWKMRIAFILGESNELAPCMFGEFSYGGKRYLCDQFVMWKLAAADTILAE